MNNANTTQNYLTHQFEIPDHYSELSKAEDAIKKLKNKYIDFLINESFNGLEHTILYEEIMKVLDYVGRLSMFAFTLEDEIEKMYVMYYKHAPNLAKKLWLDHYNEIHQPYNVQKNRCFKLLDDIDELYQNLNHENPPNWNP